MAGFACMPSMRWAGARAVSSRLKKSIVANASMDLLAKCSDLWTRCRCPAANLVMTGFGRQTPTLESGFAARASLDVPILAPMARNAFAAPLLFPPTFATGTQRRPTGCECLGCWRVGQADRTPTLHAGNLHGIPCASLSWDPGQWH